MTRNGDRRIAAAIDIGSNSIKMTIGAPDGVGGVEQTDWASEPVRLGQGLERTGRLDDDRMDAALDTLQRFAARARELGAARIVAVATDATRVAANGADFLERVRDGAGIEVRVIDGVEEAALTFRGLAATADLSGSVVVADIGGGSTEIIVAREGTVLGSRSLTLGSGRLTDRLIAADPPARDELSACQEEAATAIESVVKPPRLPIAAGARLLILGGTGEYLARLVDETRPLDLPVIRQVLERLMTTPAAALAGELEIPEARARVLPAGVAVVAALAATIQPAAIEIARGGIRTGLLLELFAGTNGIGDSPSPNGSQAGDDRALMVPRKTTSPLQESDPDAVVRFRDAMRSLIGERWQVVWKTIPAAVEGADSEGVHDVRVASRRLRAAMDIGIECFPAKWYKPLHRAAKEITGALGEVRDRDVLIEALRADRDAAPLAEHPGIDRLIARIERERAAARAAMETYLGDLERGPLRAEVERRFGGEPRDAAASRGAAGSHS